MFLSEQKKRGRRREGIYYRRPQRSISNGVWARTKSQEFKREWVLR